jgi:hypothetical protein
MLYYYMPGLDVSNLSEHEWVIRLTHLVKIRAMEGDASLQSALKKLIGG